jgi:hypothetical protein
MITFYKMKNKNNDLIEGYFIPLLSIRYIIKNISNKTQITYID